MDSFPRRTNTKHGFEVTFRNFKDSLGSERCRECEISFLGDMLTQIESTTRKLWLLSVNY